VSSQKPLKKEMMSNKQLLCTAIIGLSIVACGSSKKADPKTTPTDTTKTEQTTDHATSGKIDPFKDFPKDAITGNPGDFVLSPSKNWQEDGTNGKANVTYIWYNQTLAETGSEYSKIDFMSDKGVEIPNYMIIPIKSGQTAKKGDIVLTWWQSGSGMKRAIVVDDKNPSEPIVNYIDIDWTNPAKNDKGVGIGQMTEQLKPNTFHVINNTWESGTTVAVKNGNDYKSATVIKVSGDKVLTIGFGGKMAVYSKADCTPVNVKPVVKVGDMVQAPWVGTYKNLKVEKVDTKMGRVWVDDPYSDDPMVIPFGDVTTGLDIK
jgi:hypothetical protein